MPPILRILVFSLFVSVAATAPANAQSFFEKFFGFGSARPDLPPPMPSYRAPIYLPAPRDSSATDVEPRRPASTQVQTVCVRMCDGYYFPLSHRTSTRNLNAENARCKASCGNDARLFYSDDQELDPAAMIDLTGRRYDALETAFAYRKALRPGCACRPAPWSATERLRHFKYALEEAQSEVKTLAANDLPDQKGKPDAVPPVPTQAMLEVAAAAEPAPRARPAPEPRRETAREEQRDLPARTRQHYVSRQRPQVSKAGSGFSGLFGLGKQQQMVWPGDR